MFYDFVLMPFTQFSYSEALDKNQTLSRMYPSHRILLIYSFRYDKTKKTRKRIGESVFSNICFFILLILLPSGLRLPLSPMVYVCFGQQHPLTRDPHKF